MTYIKGHPYSFSDAVKILIDDSWFRCQYSERSGRDGTLKCVPLHTHTEMNTHMHTHTHLLIFTYTHTHTHTNAYTHIHTHRGRERGQTESEWFFFYCSRNKTKINFEYPADRVRWLNRKESQKNKPPKRTESGSVIQVALFVSEGGGRACCRRPSLGKQETAIRFGIFFSLRCVITVPWTGLASSFMARLTRSNLV